MGYEAKILGTRYIIELDLDDGQWFLNLNMDGITEERVALNNVSKRSIKHAIDDLLSRIHMEVNNFQKKKLLDDLETNANHIFAKIETEQKERRLLGQKSKSTSTTSKSVEERPGSESFQLQQNLISEYRRKLSEVDKVEVKQISINELKSKEDDSSQLEELVASHREVQQTLRDLDERVASLERLTMKLVEITQIILKE